MPLFRTWMRSLGYVPRAELLEAAEARDRMFSMYQEATATAHEEDGARKKLLRTLKVASTRIAEAESHLKLARTKLGELIEEIERDS